MRVSAAVETLLCAPPLRAVEEGLRACRAAVSDTSSVHLVSSSARELYDMPQRVLPPVHPDAHVIATTHRLDLDAPLGRLVGALRATGGRMIVAAPLHLERALAEDVRAADGPLFAAWRALFAEAQGALFMAVSSFEPRTPAGQTRSIHYRPEIPSTPLVSAAPLFASAWARSALEVRHPQRQPSSTFEATAPPCAAVVAPRFTPETLAELARVGLLGLGARDESTPSFAPTSARDTTISSP